MKIGKQRLLKDIRPENTQDLEKVFKKVYTCGKCNVKYGSDLKKEATPFLCPRCVLLGKI